MDTNLFVATRPSLDADFGPPTPLDALNSDSEETGPWPSEDGHYMVFCSNRTGQGDLYEVYR